MKSLASPAAPKCVATRAGSRPPCVRMNSWAAPTATNISSVFHGPGSIRVRRAGASVAGAAMAAGTFSSSTDTSSAAAMASRVSAEAVPSASTR